MQKLWYFMLELAKIVANNGDWLYQYLSTFSVLCGLILQKNNYEKQKYFRKRLNEISSEARCQFHQHFKSSFCANILLPKGSNKHILNVQKSCTQNFRTKICASNVGEIDHLAPAFKPQNRSLKLLMMVTHASPQMNRQFTN